MAPTITTSQIQRLIQIESGVHYHEPPPIEREPFVALDRHSPVLLSAPHGGMTFRNSHKEDWHEEDEYTSGIALLLAELCDVSVIASIWRTDDSDPNFTFEECSAYKRKVRELAGSGARWVMDLHGSGEFTQYMAADQLVDLGLGENEDSLPDPAARKLRQIIEDRLGQGVTGRHGRRGFPAAEAGRTITAFSSQILGINAVQIEMKPSVRVPERRVDGSGYRKNVPEGGPYRAPQEKLIAMLQALVDFIEYIRLEQ